MAKCLICVIVAIRSCRPACPFSAISPPCPETLPAPLDIISIIWNSRISLESQRIFCSLRISFESQRIAQAINHLSLDSIINDHLP